MTFYEKFIYLCSKNKVSPAKVCKDLKLSSSASTYWKRGSTPRDSTIQSIADYFVVEKSYFTENPGAIDDITAEAITKKFLFDNEPPTETEWNEILNHIKWIKYRRKYSE